VSSGRIVLDGRDLLALSERALREVRGGAIGLVFQEPLSALNPVLTVGRQLAEALRAHRRLGRRECAEEARGLLDLVGLPERTAASYPHQLSGGQRQRVLLTLALASRPGFLLADEPTTALDVTVQAQILDLLASLRARLGLGVLLVTHDLAVVAESCDRAYVMYAGQIVEEGPVPALFGSPGHPYTAGLLAALPRLGRPAGRGTLPAVPGQVADPRRLPPGCAFHPRCSRAASRCRSEQPEVVELGPRHRCRCFFPGAGEPER
jgi:peptide/nickel transport system ATP-binding protein